MQDYAGIFFHRDRIADNGSFIDGGMKEYEEPLDEQGPVPTHLLTDHFTRRAGCVIRSNQRIRLDVRKDTSAMRFDTSSILRKLFLTAGLTLSTAVGASGADLENTLYLELESGRVVIEMRPDLAPGHVERIKMLTREGFYNGVVFHRVIDGFMAQTGDPTGTGRGGSSYPDIDGEFTNEPFVRGTIGMARTQDPNSANSQWFICFDDAGFLNGEYTVWGNVVEGMDLVDGIKKGVGRSGAVDDPDHIVSLVVAADAD